MSVFVPESAIDYAGVLARGGKNLRDEDFTFFKCTACGHVYLMDYEVETVYLDGNDLSRRSDLDEKLQFSCVNCGSEIPPKPSRGGWLLDHQIT